MDIFEVNLIEVPDLFEVEIITGTSIIVNSNGTYNAIAYNGQTFVVPDTQWIDTDGTPMTTPATLPIVCTPPVTLGVDIVNSDLTLNDHANDGDTYVVADTIIKNTLGTTILTQPSATNTGVIADSVVTNSDNTFSLNVPAETNPVLADVPNVDSTGLTVMTPAQIPFVATPAVQLYASAKVMQTGQTASYRTGDDGDIESGREVDFFTLKANNPFGNTNRFTDELGGATYTNNIVIDWSTFDGVSVLGYYRIYLSSGYWDNVVDSALALSVGSFISGWHLTNRNELQNIINSSTFSIDYSPFSLATSINIWTSTTLFIDSTSAYTCNTSFGNISYLGKNALNTPKGVACRAFTVSGTILT